jgi:hypothetical protein
MLFASDQLTEDVGTHAPINRLPPELLIEILAYCTRNAALAPLTLRRVACWWKEIVDTSPRLWQNVLLNDQDRAYVLPKQQAALWTTRSQPLKYDVELQVDDLDSIFPLVSPLLSTVDRWRSFRLSGKREEEISMDNLELTPDSLTDLRLFLHDGLEDDGLPKITFTPTCLDQSYTFAMNIWSSNIPSASLLPRLRFVDISISDSEQLDLHIQPKDILDFLKACPELKSFYFSSLPYLEPVIGPLPEVHLPNLIELHLKNTCSVRPILSSLVTPRLEYVYLSHLNVDFQLLGDYHEEGDSEDEAHDVSQSPSSDHATGMGLRKLITRCNPPIKLLEMDFCDMRTKDFEYVFNRLPLLEDFHIVASDMSDKVINFLRPIFPIPGSTSTSTRVRLPCLRYLKLVHCQRLTGEAILKSLAERVAWTEAVCPESTLTEVTISGCQGFTSWDRHALSLALGRRLNVE